jgi:sigma-B regulation protein RsbU (phosphoserine phosphatase)
MRALVADDDPVLRHALSRQLRKWDFEPVVYADGVEVRRAMAAGALPQIAVIDWHMPGADGLTLCEEIRKLPQGDKVYIILVTSNSDKRDVIAGLNSGADDYVVKPFEWDELQARVRIGARTARLQGMLTDQVAELEQALGRVRRLSGLLPICSYCKSIRGDQNYWQAVETYLVEHSDATFTHGICPPCFDKVKASYGCTHDDAQSHPPVE